MNHCEYVYDEHRRGLCPLRLAIVTAQYWNTELHPAYLLCLDTMKFPVESYYKGYAACWKHRNVNAPYLSNDYYMLNTELWHQLRGTRKPNGFKYYSSVDDAIVDYWEAYRRVHQP